MGYKFEKMTQQQAEEIAYHWHYEGEYSFYDMEADQEDLVEFLNPETRADTYVVLYENEMIGFFSFSQTAERIIEIGLGMRPDLTGRGQGLTFMHEGIKFARSTFNPEKITLSVATFNQRAIKVYKKIGFKEVETFMQETNGDRFEPQSNQANHIAIWKTAGTDDEWPTRVEVGRDRSQTPPGGGTGTVMIELVSDENTANQPDVSSIMVTGGSDEQDGIKVVETDSVQIRIQGDE